MPDETPGAATGIPAPAATQKASSGSGDVSPSAAATSGQKAPAANTGGATPVATNTASQPAQPSADLPAIVEQLQKQVTELRELHAEHDARLKKYGLL